MWKRLAVRFVPLVFAFALPTAALAADVLPVLFAQNGDAVVIPSSSRNYVLDILLVLVLFGAALFAICKSSRRT